MLPFKDKTKAAQVAITAQVLGTSENMELNFEEIFKITLRAMRINRTDPAIKRDTKWLLQFILVHGQYTIVFLILVYNIIFVDLKEHNFPQTCKNSVISLVYLTITYQYSIMLWKQQRLKILMDTMERDYILAKSLPVEEQIIIHKYAMKGKHVCHQWLIISTCGSGTFIVKSIFLILYYWIVDGKVALIPLYDLVYPDFIEKRKENIVIYTLLYIIILIYALYSSVMYCAFVPLGPIFMLHACGQLELVEKRIDSLFNNDLESAREKLKDIVKQLQYIYDFVDRIKLCFRVAYELSLKITTIILPITCYEVIESLKRGELSLEFLTFIIGGTLFSSSPCFYSTLLMDKSEDVRLAMYSCGWERVYDRGIRSTVGIVLQRALRPVAIRTLFRTVCLEALTDLFQQSYTIFNLMNAVWD